MDGIAESSGLHPESVRALGELWIQSVTEDAVARWLQRMEVAGAEPVGSVALVAPGNLFVATWTAMLEPWLCGNTVHVRPGSGDPLAPGKLAAALGGQGFAIHSFARGDPGGWDRLLAGTSALAVYGGDAAVNAVRARSDDAGWSGRFRGHGHRVSIARAPSWKLREKAEDIAFSAFVADGRGCMSLRALLTDAGAANDLTWAHHVLACAAQWPAGRIAPQWMVERRAVLEQARFDAATGAPIVVLEGDDAAVIIDMRPRDALGLADLGPGGRLLLVVPDAPLSASLQRRLASPPATIDTIANMQAPPIWRDPDGYPVGEAFLRKTPAG